MTRFVASGCARAIILSGDRTFPAPPVNWGALLGLGALAIAASGSTATESPRGSDITPRPERRTGKKRVFVSFDFDNDKVLNDFITGQARNPDPLKDTRYLE